MLFILIPAAWLAVVLFGLSMCRLAALSDDSQAAALAERISASSRNQHTTVAPDSPVQRRPSDPRRGAYRATG